MQRGRTLLEILLIGAALCHCDGEIADRGATTGTDGGDAEPASASAGRSSDTEREECIGQRSPCPDVPAPNVACNRRDSTCQAPRTENCEWDCAEIRPGTTGTIYGTCTSDGNLRGYGGECTRVPIPTEDGGAAPSNDASASADATLD